MMMGKFWLVVGTQSTTAEWAKDLSDLCHVVTAMRGQGDGDTQTSALKYSELP